MIDATLAEDLAFAAEAGQIGLATADETQRMLARVGALSAWAPAPGRPASACALLTAMEDALEGLKSPGAPPLALASMRLEATGSALVTIVILWRAAARRFLMLTTPDEGGRQLDRLLFQGRRETQMLQQQAAAAADRLELSDRRYREIVDATEDYVLRLRPDLTVSFANPRAAELFGLPADQALGRPIRALLPLPADANPWRADMCASGDAGFEQPAARRAGDMIWCGWRVRWLGEGERPGEFQAVGRDVTQARRLAAERDRAGEEAKFAALAEERLRIAHDLHDTFIHALVNLQARLTLMRRASPEGALRDDIAEAERQARDGLSAAREAVNDIRRAADFPDGPVPALAAAAQKLAGGRDIAVEIRIDPGLAAAPPPVATAMVRVAREALRNVALHSGARRARLEARAEDERFRLTVEDDGVGFDPARPRDGHYGLAGMREQARLIGGALTFARPEGGGARVDLSIRRGGLS